MIERPSRDRRGFAMTVALAAVLAATTLPAPARGQTVRELTHRTTFHEAFGFLQSVRELSDGRVMVADPLGGMLVILDLATGAMEPVGREGGGPGEWRQPDAVYPLPGDSTLLVDLGNARLSILDPDGAYVDSHPMTVTTPGDGPGAGPGARPGAGATPRPGLGGFQVLHPRATDGSGRIYYQARSGMMGPGARPGAPPDSLEVRRWDRGDDDPVRLAGLRPPAVATTSTGGAGNVMVRAQPIPLAPQDDWAVAPDGHIALVRADPYRVEWLQPDGRLVQGPVVQYRPVPVRTPEKERWLEGLGGGLTVSVTVEGGAPSTQFRRGGGGGGMHGGQGSVDDYEWPATLPAIRTGGARIDPNGRVWVERYGAVGSPTEYDVFDRRGARIATIRLPADRRVIGFGRSAVYAVHVDDLGLHWLEVYDPPR
jgi:hypothetical protein